MRPKYVLKHLLKFQFLQNILTSDRNFCHLSHLRNIHFLPFLQFSGGYPQDPRNFWEAKLGKCGQISTLCPKSNKQTTNVEKWCFLRFLKIFDFWKFLTPQVKFSKTRPEPQKFLPNSKIIKIVHITVNDVSKCPARVF